MKNRFMRMCLTLMTITMVMVSVVPVSAASSLGEPINEELGQDDFMFTEEEINRFRNNDMSNMNLTNRSVEFLGDDLCAVTEDYEGIPSHVRAAFTTINESRKWTLYNTKTGEIKVVFTLFGKFKYNGKTSLCVDAYVNVDNRKPSQYTILSQTKQVSGKWAYGYCSAQNKTGRIFAKTMKIGIKANGTIVKP